MRYTEEMVWLAKQEGISVHRYPIRPEFNGLYVRAGDLHRTHILIDTEIPEDSIEYRAIFAEELGHHYTTAGNWVIAACAPAHSRRVIRDSVELKALRWGVEYLVPPDALLYLLKRRYNVWEIAEELRVPEAWVLEQMYRMQQRGYGADMRNECA